MSNKTPISSVNDFVVRFANVNGSGSASANELFARVDPAHGRAGFAAQHLPVQHPGPADLVRGARSRKPAISARRGGVDLMVAMNPQTWDKDVAMIEPGGYLLYDYTKPLPASKFRDDITVIGVPLTAICNREYTDPRQRQLFKNIIYVGALSALLDMDVAAIEKLIEEQFKGKEKLFAANNARAASRPRLGADEPRMPDRAAAASAPTRSATAFSSRATAPPRWARSMAAPPSAPGIRSRRHPRSRTPSPATASGCASIPRPRRTTSPSCRREDELASIGMVIGAAWNGARAFTATSGPGISLMQEFLGLAYFAEIPAVLFDVQRAGPSTGMPTRTQQCDVISCAYASHGDTKHVLLFPEDPAEAFEFGAHAFDLADRLQTPIFVMLDLDIGMNHRLCRPLAWDDSTIYDRGKVMTRGRPRRRQGFGRYLDVDGDGIPYRTYPGTHPTKGAFFTRGTSRDRYARYTEEGGRLRRQHAAAAAQVRDRQGSGAATAASQRGEADALRRDLLRLDFARDGRGDRHAQGARQPPRHAARARLSVPSYVDDFIADHDFVFVVEQNRDAQLRSLVVNECGIDPVRLVPILHYDGTPITARFIANAIGDRLDALKVTPLRKVVS